MLSINEIKDLILFAKDNKVKNIKVGEFACELSDYAHIEQLSGFEGPKQNIKEDLDSSKTLTDTNLQEQDTDDDETLFWSSTGQ